MAGEVQNAYLEIASHKTFVKKQSQISLNYLKSLCF